jgi:dienelactone hydrolase
MKAKITIAALAWTLIAAPTAAQPLPRQFSVASADGAEIHGQADLPNERSRAAVVFVAGTGLFDRDARFGRSGTPRDLVFADLAQRVTARGVAAVRYDRRGVRHGVPVAEMLDTAISGTSTVQSQREDLTAVYAWARARDGLNARCVVLFGHSEGLLHIARLAESGARAPDAVIAVGGLLESPLSVVQWQISGRDTHSLSIMDADGDGRVTNAEVEANFPRTPSSFVDTNAPFIQPDGEWTAEEIAQVGAVQGAMYQQMRDQSLAQSDDAPYPNAQTPMARYSWWKSWFLDDTPAAVQLARWRVPMIFHYGSKDSQTNYDRQRAAAGDLFGTRATFVLHQDRGHSLGEHALFGPMDEALADRIADEAAAACGA